MKQIVLGTAGHIDHGKTSLIKALTDIDTDRLKEEKERGITIDLGFAFLNLTDEVQLGIVDVPGHERFVKNMLAGVGGIDLVLLVIAADEGVMPQTREHLAICDLLRVQEGLVALTKTDMVEAEWLELVRDDTAEFLRGTFLEGKPIVPVSSRTGEGLEVLLQTLRATCESLNPRASAGPVRMPIDRVFTMRGFGAVVTGTLFSGRVRLEDRLEVLPNRRLARVRGLQAHSQTVNEAVAGQRTAVNLQGVELDDLQRGDVLATPGRFPASYMLDVTLKLLDDAPRPLKHRARVRFHVGTSEIMGRVMLLDRDEMRPGHEVCAQLHLEQPTVAAARDRYVIRSYSPVQTIGGGVILDAVPVRHRRHRPQVMEQLAVLRDGSDAAVLAVHLFNAGYAGLQWPELVQRTPLEDGVLRGVVAEVTTRGTGVKIDDSPLWLLHRARYDQASAEMRRLVEDFHQNNPLKPAMITEELRSKFPRMADKVFSVILRDLTAAGELDVTRDKVKLTGHSVHLSPEKQALVDALEQTFREAAFQPPSVDEALASQDSKPADARAFLQVLVDQDRLVRLKGDVFYHREALDLIEQRLRAHLEIHREISAGEFRDMLEISRKYAIPLLEHFDSKRMTLRTGDKRVLRNP